MSQCATTAMGNVADQARYSADALRHSIRPPNGDLPKSKRSSFSRVADSLPSRNSSLMDLHMENLHVPLSECDGSGPHLRITVLSSLKWKTFSPQIHFPCNVQRLSSATAFPCTNAQMMTDGSTQLFICDLGGFAPRKWPPFTRLCSTKQARTASISAQACQQ